MIIFKFLIILVSGIEIKKTNNNFLYLLDSKYVIKVWYLNIFSFFNINFISQNYSYNISIFVNLLFFNIGIFAEKKIESEKNLFWIRL